MLANFILCYGGLKRLAQHREFTMGMIIRDVCPRGCDQRSLVTFTPPLELAAALGAIAKTRPTSGWLERPAVPTWD